MVGEFLYGHLQLVNRLGGGRVDLGLGLEGVARLGEGLSIVLLQEAMFEDHGVLLVDLRPQLGVTGLDLLELHHGALLELSLLHDDALQLPLGLHLVGALLLHLRELGLEQGDLVVEHRLLVLEPHHGLRVVLLLEVEAVHHVLHGLVVLVHPLLGELLLFHLILGLL